MQCYITNSCALVRYSRYCTNGFVETFVRQKVRENDDVANFSRDSLLSHSYVKGQN